MPTKEQKNTTLQKLKGKFGRAQIAIVTDYRGLTVKEMTDLRRRLQKIGAELTVAKNTIIQLATREMPEWQV
ncbi:MAG: 50S ribosomal protein L10, partial [Cyanobacteria bacterium NC_groundwater_1444_Ag_S-0.65um_54_12]|nr:50S ribosomal protein L10 [Cyanobacteria bacterium NC_groundwater_1444_Ag_S-0.65um_54_12]